MRRDDAACASRSTGCASCGRRFARAPTTTHRAGCIAQAHGAAWSRRSGPRPPARPLRRPWLRPCSAGSAGARWPLRSRLVAVLAVTLNLAWLPSSQDERLLDDVVASHVRSTLGQHLVDVASSDHHTVKPWLSSKLDFSPPVTELQIPGSVFLGGRVDYLDGRPVAALVYRQGEHVVNSFVWPSTAKDSKAEFSEERGFQTAHWSQRRHDALGDLGREPRRVQDRRPRHPVGRGRSLASGGARSPSFWATRSRRPVLRRNTGRRDT